MNKHIDLRDLPSYSIKEVAHYLRTSAATVRTWTIGKESSPLIKIADAHKRSLSFLNLCEIHVLDAIRREHSIPMQKIRASLKYLEDDLKIERPLINVKLKTDGVNLFINKYGELLNITKNGQFAMKKVLEAYLKRIEYDTTGTAIRMYPYTRKKELDEQKTVVIDPMIAFGRPVLIGTGIATAVIAERYKAGESIEDLAYDYGRESSEIQEAIRCELSVNVAA